MRKRVVVTGVGAISPLGLSADALWDGLLAGRSGAGPITLFDAEGYPVTFAAEVKDFEPDAWIDRKEVKKLDRFLQFAVGATNMAMADAALEVTEEIADDVAVLKSEIVLRVTRFGNGPGIYDEYFFVSVPVSSHDFNFLVIGPAAESADPENQVEQGWRLSDWK